jgi:hypothetical protein
MSISKTFSKSHFLFKSFFYHTTCFSLYGHHQGLNCHMVKTAVLLLFWLRSLYVQLRLSASESHSDGPFFTCVAYTCCYDCFVSLFVCKREWLSAKEQSVAILWDIAPCSLYVNQRSSETSVHIRTTRCYNPEDVNIHNCHCENLKSYIQKTT